jgi:hypothetical protein
VVSSKDIIISHSFVVFAVDHTPTLHKVTHQNLIFKVQAQEPNATHCVLNLTINWLLAVNVLAGIV